MVDHAWCGRINIISFMTEYQKCLTICSYMTCVVAGRAPVTRKWTLLNEILMQFNKKWNIQSVENWIAWFVQISREIGQAHRSISDRFQVRSSLWWKRKKKPIKLQLCVCAVCAERTHDRDRNGLILFQVFRLSSTTKRFGYASQNFIIYIKRIRFTVQPLMLSTQFNVHCTLHTAPHRLQSIWAKIKTKIRWRCTKTCRFRFHHFKF